MIIDSRYLSLDVAFLERGAAAAKAVARLRFGTGFLISRDLVLTAYPILFDDPGTVRTASKSVRVLFDYAAAADGSPLATLSREGIVTSVTGDAEAHWAVIRLTRPVPRRFPVLRLSCSAAAVAGGSVHIIHHPEGTPKKVAIGNNAIVEVSDDDFSYTASTTFGSLGAPVFNDHWELIGMHYLADPKARVNRAVRIGRIAAGLQDKHIRPTTDDISPAYGPAQLYISACSGDLDVAEKLETFLAPLRRAGKLCVWHRGKIPPGVDVTEAATQKRRAANIILLLTTAEYLASDDAMAEAADALAQAKTQKTAVIPILVRPSMWQDTPFGGHQCLPHDGQVLMRPFGSEEAFLAVARAIGSLVVDEEL